MTEITKSPQSEPEISQMVDQAYERGVEHTYEKNYDNGTSAPATPNPGGGISSAAISEIVDQLMNDTPPEDIRPSEVRNLNEQFAALSVDEKLAVFYFIYQGMGDSVTPAALGAASLELTGTFFSEFNSLSSDEDQLEAQRALVRGDDCSLCHAYSSQTENNKLAIWYLIAERMGKDVVGMPADYQASDNANQTVTALKELDFSEQITFLRDIANGMGCAPVEPELASSAT